MVPEAVWTAGAERDLLEIYLQLFDAFDGDADLISRVLRSLCNPHSVCSRNILKPGRG